MKKLFLAILATLSISSNSLAISANDIRFHNEANDTTIINRILASAAKAKLATAQERIAFIARQLIGTPYVAHTLEHQPEALTINMSELDCTTFVETVMALSCVIAEGRNSWRDFAHNLERLRYRNGTIDGYSSRLHYISDWILNNSHRGNFQEATSLIPNSDYQVKTLDFMTTHRESYSALTDSAEYERLKNVEIGFRSHRFPYIKRERLSKKETINAIKEGDIVALTCKTQGLDVSHLGIIVKIDGTPHLLHASSKAKTVLIDQLPLFDYLNRSRSLTGIRVIRFND